jgi:predicted phosphodiesterase
MDFSEFLELFKQFDNRDSNLINELIGSVYPKIVQDKILITIKNGSGSVFVGDTHGDFKTVLSIIRIFLDGDYKRIFFLGDYVDRGYADMQIMTVNVLLHLKKFLPERVFLLRGNHEWRYINAEYGFKQAIFHHLNTFLFSRYNELFEQMPIAVKVENPRILALHGGIPINVGKKPYSINVIAGISKKTCFEDDLAQQILWNDPDEKVDTVKKNHRGLGYIFGLKPFKKFMKHNDLKYCIRSHEIMKNGNGSCFDGRLITIFSTKSYGKKIKPKILIINDKGNIEYIEIPKEKLY